MARAIASGDVRQSDLPVMTDSQLDAALMHAKDEKVRQLFDRLNKRQLPKTAVLLKAVESPAPDDGNNKDIQVFRIPLANLELFSLFDRREEAIVHENAIAEIAGIPSEAILLTPVAAPHRFIPEDVAVYNGSRIIGTLKEFHPGHYSALREISVGYAAVRVCVWEEYRKQTAQSRTAKAIFKYLMRIASDI